MSWSGLNLALVLVVGCACGRMESWGQGAASKSSAQTAYQRGVEALRKGDLVSARSDLEKAVHAASGFADAHTSLAWVLAAQGELDGAIAHLRTALKLRPGSVDAHLLLATILNQQGKLAEAESEARAAVKAAPAKAEPTGCGRRSHRTFPPGCGIGAQDRRVS
jgi:type IV pilus assembly protein PilF